jgi:hypothetical protein
MKPVKIHPNSPMAKIVLKMWEDKQLIKAYIRGEITKQELESKGIEFVNPL